MDDRRILLIQNDFLSFFIRRILDSRDYLSFHLKEIGKKMEKENWRVKRCRVWLSDFDCGSCINEEGQ